MQVATFFVSYLSYKSNNNTALNLTGFNPNVDYCIRIVDSAHITMQMAAQQVVLAL